jgi:hypothetical protein
MRSYTFLVFMSVIGLAFVGCSLPRRSESSIRKRLLRDTPRGSSYENVSSYLKSRGWPVQEWSGGYEIPNFEHAPSRKVGQRVIKAYLGHYQGLPWRVDVDCFWAFDERERLIDISIDKQTDAP